MFRRARTLLVAWAWLVCGGFLLAADFYVAPNGSPSGSGSLNSPWDFQTALDQPSSVQPGDTIWLRGGTYVGHYTSNLNGTSTSPSSSGSMRASGRRSTATTGRVTPR